MSSISTASNKTRSIMFQRVGHRRQRLRLGKVGMDVAREVQRHLDELIAAESPTRPVARETAAWVSRMPGALHNRMAALGLITARVVLADMTLKSFCQGVIDRRTDWATPTRLKHDQCLAHLLGQFGPNGDIRTFTEADAKDFRREQAKKFSEATVATRVACAKRLFADAVDRRIIERNPFAKVKGGSFVSEHTAYIKVETIEAVMAFADVEWKALIALSRFGGLRVPSELTGLRWQDINFVTGMMRVTSPKTAKQGKPFRMVPIFPELRPYLKALPRRLDDDRLFGDRVTEATNLRSGLMKLIEKASVHLWPRLWHNLRGSRQTDLMKKHQLHVVCAWIGNSPKIAMRHYLRVTEDDIQAALEGGAESGARAEGNARQGATLPIPMDADSLDKRENPANGEVHGALRMVEAGIVEIANTNGETSKGQTGGALSGAPDGSADDGSEPPSICGGFIRLRSHATLTPPNHLVYMAAAAGGAL